MCVVIDADTFSEISDESNKDFKPLRNWISQEGHTVIHGGSEYKEHLKNHGKFRGYLKDLWRAGSTQKLNDEEIDNTEVFLQTNFVKAKYNDHHIVAILLVSGCKVVSSHDQGLHELIKDCWSSGGKMKIEDVTILLDNRPVIYQYQSHKVLLDRRSVSHCCI